MDLLRLMILGLAAFGLVGLCSLVLRLADGKPKPTPRSRDWREDMLEDYYTRNEGRR